MQKNVFVFVVCGAKEHIETLHFSLKYLRYYTRNEIWIVTDFARNEIAIQHEIIIHIDTPEHYNHHQASIYLKTGLHRFLPEGNKYCYLDTDVIALSEDCDGIFNTFIPPIIFAPDHCKINKFSPHAVHCGCLEKWKKSRGKLDIHLEELYRRKATNERQEDAIIELEKHFSKAKETFFKRMSSKLWFQLSLHHFKLNNHYYFDKIERAWKSNDGEIVMYEIDLSAVEKKTGFRFDWNTERWFDKEGVDVFMNECDHLEEQILKTFDIKITDKNWHHWNGGVFLFNNQSKAFMESWHQKCLHIFDSPEWKVRDQGTLITTVWESGLQNHAVLDKKWNFLADTNNLQLDFNNEGYFTLDEWENKHKVSFIHIYHRFGDKTWDLWNFVADKIPHGE